VRATVVYCDVVRALGLSTSVPPVESRLTCTSKRVAHVTSVQSSATCFAGTVEPLAGETRLGRAGFAEHAAGVGVFVPVGGCALGVEVAVAVAAGSGVGVRVEVAVGERVAVPVGGCALGVAVAVPVGGCALGVAVRVGVGVRVEVAVGVRVAVAVPVGGCALGVAVGGGVLVEVAPGAAPAISRRLSIQNEEPWPWSWMVSLVRSFPCLFRSLKGMRTSFHTPASIVPPWMWRQSLTGMRSSTVPSWASKKALSCGSPAGEA
jgi:hypothetical protein